MTDTSELIRALDRIQGNPSSLKCVCDTGENPWRSITDKSQPTFDVNWMTVGVTDNRAAMDAMENSAPVPGFPETEFLLLACRRCGTLKAVKI